MTSSPSRLTGRRGWSVVVGLSTALAVLVVGQLPAASADAPLVAGSAAVAVASAPSSPSSPSPLPAAEERTAAPRPAAAQPVAQPAAPPPAAVPPAAVPPPAVQPAAAQPVAKPAAPQPAPGPCSGDGWQQRRGAAALASLQGGAERTGFRVEFRGARKGYLGLTHLQERRIEVFVRACGTQSDELLRHVMAHELGHAYDTTHGSAATRRAWMAVRGIPDGTPWYGCSGCTDFATPAGDFAEVYAQWARGSSTNRSELAGDVPPAQLVQLARQFFGA